MKYIKKNNMYKVKRFSCMIEFIQKEFNKRTKNKRKAATKAKNSEMHQRRAAKKLRQAEDTINPSAFHQPTEAEIKRAEQLKNQAERLQTTARGEASQMQQQVGKLTENTTPNQHGTKVIKSGDTSFKVDVDGDVRVKPKNGATLDVSNGNATLTRKVNYAPGVKMTEEISSDSLERQAKNLDKTIERGKESLAKTTVGQAPKVEQKAAQVAEEVVAHKPAAPTMEQIAKEGENLKKGGRKLGKLGKAGLIAAGTAATAGLIYGGKKLYDRKKVKESRYSNNSDYRQSSKYHNDVAKGGVALGATGLGIGAWAGHDIAKNTGKVKEARNLVASGKMTKADAIAKYGKNLKGLSRGIYNAGTLAVPLAAVGAITYGVSKHRANKLKAQGK